MLKIVLGCSVALVVMIAGLTFAQFVKDFRLEKKYAYLIKPAIRAKPDVTVLMVEATGDPDRIGKRGFGELFRTYFKLDQKYRVGLPAPRARWNATEISNKTTSSGRFAVPVMDGTPQMTFSVGKSGLTPRIQHWRYGEVAEILHKGSYDDEASTITVLLQFIEQKRYEITGDHEEEYIRGPGMLGPDTPQKYLTIIRYPVRKRE